MPMARKRWGRIVIVTSAVRTSYPAAGRLHLGEMGALRDSPARPGGVRQARRDGELRRAGRDRHGDACGATRGSSTSGPRRPRSRWRLGAPDDVAAGDRLPASDEAAYVNGTTLRVVTAASRSGPAPSPPVDERRSEERLGLECAGYDGRAMSRRSTPLDAPRVHRAGVTGAVKAAPAPAARRQVLRRCRRPQASADPARPELRKLISLVAIVVREVRRHQLRRRSAPTSPEASRGDLVLRPLRGRCSLAPPRASRLMVAARVPLEGKVFLDVGAKHRHGLALRPDPPGRAQSMLFEPQPSKPAPAADETSRRTTSPTVASCVRPAVSGEPGELTVEESEDNIGDHRVRTADDSWPRARSRGSTAPRSRWRRRRFDGSLADAGIPLTDVGLVWVVCGQATRRR